MDIQVTDSLGHEVILLDSTHRYKDKEGYLIIKDNPIACAGVFPFARYQISDNYPPDEAHELVPVYRSPESLKDAQDMFRNKPIVYHHKWVGKDGDTQQADGSIGSEVTYKDGALHADLIIYNQDLIKAIELGTCKQLSPGYNAKIIKDNGIYDNQVYNYSITYTGVNHLGVVENGRAGSRLSILDQGTIMGNNNASNNNGHSKRIDNHVTSATKVAKAQDAKEIKKEEKPKETKRYLGDNNFSIYKRAKERLKRGELSDSDINAIKSKMEKNRVMDRVDGIQRKLNNLEKKYSASHELQRKQRDAEDALATITKYIPTWVRRGDTDASSNYRSAYTYLTKERLPDSMDPRTAFITLCETRKTQGSKVAKVKSKVQDTNDSEKLKYIQGIYNQAIAKQMRINSMIRKGA